MLDAGQRPQVENWLLSWVAREPLRRADFFETSTGNCRLRSHLCAKLSETAPTWGKLIAPWAEWIAQFLWDSVRKRIRSVHTFPTHLPQRRRREGPRNQLLPD